MRNRPLATYLILTAALAPFAQSRYISGAMAQDRIEHIFVLQWSCAAAAVLTCLICRRGFRSLGWRWPGLKWMAASYALPVIYAAFTYSVVWALGLGAISSRSAYIIDFLPRTLTTLMFLSFVFCLGEEIGWRGFLAPELAKRMSFTATCIVSGLIWAVWHYPIIIFGDYHGQTPTWYSLTCFTVMVLGISFPFTWFRLKTGSVWTAAMLHASHNLFIQGVFDRLTADTGPTPYVVGEFGAGLAITSLLLAAWFWSRRRAVEAPPPAVAMAATA